MARSGFAIELDETDDGRHALKQLRLAAYDFAFIDVKLSGIDGLELACQIQPLGLATRITLLTTSELEPVAQAGRYIGVDAVLRMTFYARDIDLALHNALGQVPGLAGLRPHPDPKQPRATVLLRAGQPIDLWGLRSRLRDQGVEVTGILSATRTGDRLRVELPRWKTEKDSDDAQQCMDCRDRTAALLETLKWTDSVKVVGGGIDITPDIETSGQLNLCLLYTSPSPRDLSTSRMPSSA